MTTVCVKNTSFCEILNRKPAGGKLNAPVPRPRFELCYRPGCKRLETGFIDKNAVRMAAFLSLIMVSLSFGQVSPIGEIPSGTTLEIRVEQTVSSYSSKRRQPVHALLIRP